ncbi:26S proteasome regulatory subunit N7 [Saprolegnia diclina VS20]|uniref:26S proteasome regulatory subunit N7 n=1 Tax=Saprolegnia diclina (strain VS20) TaxID=1156394 RepID=T0S664_SAPDV|nr:26S proteasome regulatory subunit N7 [Saprolegnia diclina VS20]EQC40603.1 26S proteasome regulatory subunit N7 [Saprolegnia diclina VS20]|eukprot:XP_008606302.1 26S proteasome regulatory subunit N7 [Saprolegnia diclina VS20]
MADEVDYDSDSNAMQEDTEHSRSAARSFKGRGARLGGMVSDSKNFKGVGAGDTKSKVLGEKSVEGYVLFVSNVHEEAQEEDLLDAFQEVADVANIHLNLDRRTGFVKGYALLEFKTAEDASEVIAEMNNKELLGQTIKVDWAFVKEQTGGNRRAGANRSRRQ